MKRGLGEWRGDGGIGRDGLLVGRPMLAPQAGDIRLAVEFAQGPVEAEEVMFWRVDEPTPDDPGEIWRGSQVEHIHRAAADANLLAHPAIEAQDREDRQRPIGQEGPNGEAGLGHPVRIDLAIVAGDVEGGEEGEQPLVGDDADDEGLPRLRRFGQAGRQAQGRGLSAELEAQRRQNNDASRDDARLGVVIELADHGVPPFSCPVKPLLRFVPASSTQVNRSKSRFLASRLHHE